MKYKLLFLLLAALLLTMPALVCAEGSADNAPAIVSAEVLSLGMEGDAVVQLQNDLTRLCYYEGEITGSYGELTQAAVQAFQADFALPVTGQADAATQEAISTAEYRPLRLGCVGEDVRQLQVRLKALGYYTGNPSGNYLKATQEGVFAFQQFSGMPATGEADLLTLARIYAEDALTSEAGLALYEQQHPEAFHTPEPTPEATAEPTPEVTLVPPSATAAPAAEPETEPESDEIEEVEEADESEEVAGDEGDVQLTEDEEESPEEDEPVEAEPLATPAPTVAYTKMLKYESTGAKVKDVQNRLTELGYYDHVISGKFLGNTRNAVKAFQKNNGLEVDGIIGEMTWNALFNDPEVRSATDDPKPSPSPTPIPYYIVVDVNNQVTTVYGVDENGEYTNIVRQMLCSTGTKSYPSDLGDWVLNGRHARWCYFPKWGSHAQYWTRINSSIAFHSVVYNTVDTMDLSVKSYTNLGKRASHGCIRLTVNDAKWIYNNIDAGVTVHITESLPSDPELRAALKLPALNKQNMLPYVTATPTVAPQYVSGTLPYELKTLKKNSKGEDVFWLQSKLKELGYYNGHIGGTYLDGTVKAVKAFQKDHGLSQSGTADYNTLRLIYKEELATPVPPPTPTPTASPVPTPSPIPTPTPVPTPTPLVTPTEVPKVRPAVTVEPNK